MEQIHVRLKAQPEKDPDWTVCARTIYLALPWPTEGGLSRSWTRRLRTGRAEISPGPVSPNIGLPESGQQRTLERTKASAAVLRRRGSSGQILES